MGLCSAELRYPPEPENAGGFFATVFGGSNKKGSGVNTSVNDADVLAAVAQAASSTAFPGSAASRTAEVCRRLHSASGWLQLASSVSSGNETVVVRHRSSGAHAGDSMAACAGEAGSNAWGVVELSRTLMDLVSFSLLLWSFDLLREEDAFVFGNQH